MRGIFIVSIVLLSLVISGCVDPTPPAPQGTASDPDASPGFRLDLQDCQEAGSVAVYSRTMYERVGSNLPDPWQPADVREELGSPPSKSLEPATGHWHMAFVCGGVTQQATSPFGFGLVGIQVEAPAWDVGGAARHLLLSGWSLPDATLAGAVGEASGFYPTETVRSTIEDLGAGALDVVHEDAHKGTYEARGVVQPYQTKDPHTVRWWLQVPAENGTQPVWFDVHHESPTEQATTPDVTGIGCHTGTHMHGPQGGLCGDSSVVHYRTAAITVTFGGHAPVVLDHEWDH